MVLTSINYARSADPDVLDADAYGPEIHGRPGEVDVYVLSRSADGVPSSALLDRVNAVLSEDDVRPLSDFVRVLPAELLHYDVIAELEIPPGPDAETVLQAAVRELTKYTAEMHRISAVVPLSGIYRALHQPGVTRVHLTKPAADIEGGTGAAPTCQLIKVTRQEATNDV